MSDTREPLLFVGKNTGIFASLRRFARGAFRRECHVVPDLTEASLHIMKEEPAALMIDISEYKHKHEFLTKLEPFVLSLPGWIPAYLVDGDPTETAVKRAAGIGAQGVIKTPMSHDAILRCLEELEAKRNIQKDQK